MADSSGMDLSALLAPWMAQDPTDPSQYGGVGQMGLNLLAASGPTPYKQPGMVALANGMMPGQQNALKMAQARMQLGGTAIGIQQQMAMMPLIMRRLAQMSGRGSVPQPQGAPTPDSTQTAAPPPPPYLAADPSQGAQQPSPTESAPVGDAPAGQSAPWMDALDNAQFAGMLSLARGNPQGMLDASKLSLEYDPSAATAMGLAKDPLTLDRAMVQQSLARGDVPGAQAAYIKYLKDAGQVTVSSRDGTLTTLGGISPQALGFASTNPGRGTQIANGTMSAIPGAPNAFGSVAGAEAGGRAANTPAVLPTAGGGSTYGYPGDIAGIPPALRVPGMPQRRPGVPVPPTQTLAPGTNAPKGNDPWASIPKLQIPTGIGESDYFTQGRLKKAGEKDADLSGELGQQAALAEQQLEYNSEARNALKGADTGPLSEWLTRNRASLMELGVPASLIPASGTVVPTQELNKALKNAALQGARSTYGPRMSQMEVMLQTDEMSPSSAMMRDAIASLMKQNDIRNTYTKQRAEDYGKYRAAGGDPMRFESWYATKFPLTAFARAASATPEQIMAEARRRGLIQ